MNSVQKVIESDSRTVTVFGSSAVRPGHPEYDLAEEIGREIGRAGYILCNGGYMGSMEASAKGAHEAGGEVIGVTVGEFRNRVPNPYLSREVHRSTLLGRIETLIALGDAYVVLAGGMGTLAELFIVWNLLMMHCMPEKPVLLLGDHYGELLETLQRLTEVKPKHLDYLTVVATTGEAMEILQASLGAARQEYR